jgi:hypothetical protein
MVIEILKLSNSGDSLFDNGPYLGKEGLNQRLIHGVDF